MKFNRILSSLLQTIGLLLVTLTVIELLRLGIIPFPSSQIQTLIVTSLLAIVFYISFSQGRLMSIVAALGATLYFIYFYQSTGRADNSEAFLQRILTIGLALTFIGYSAGSVRRKIHSLLARESLARQKAEKITEAMKELEERKDEFVSMASHELKTPLASARIYSQLLEKHLKEEEDKKALAYVQKIDKQVVSLSSLVDDLLDLSKIQAGKMEFNEAPFDINVVAQDVTDMFRHLAKNHTISLNGKARNLVVGDKQRITQVLTNLVSNAVKYSSPGKKVIVSVVPSDDFAEVRVKDFGRGIDTRNKGKIFDRFFRIKNSSERKQGLGLGLYISNEIIKKHKGKLWVKSKFGKGSTFHFTVPYYKTS